jgi:hypothetical protein
MYSIDSFAASSLNASITIANNTAAGSCGMLLPGDQGTTLVLNTGSGWLMLMTLSGFIATFDIQDS